MTGTPRADRTSRRSRRAAPDATTVDAAILTELRALRAEVGDLRRAQRRDARRLRGLERMARVELERRRMELDGIPALRAELESRRRDPDYDVPFTDPEPLVSVRIASFERTRQLMDVTLPSVLAQSYDRLEVVVVNDGPNPRTRDAVTRLGDARVRYEELPVRGHYPRHRKSRWRVAGTPAGNRGIDLCSGSWIAVVDDDDELSPDHLETLLALARAERAELVWGALVLRDLVAGVERRIWCDEPTKPAFRFQSALYHSALTMFRYEPLAWTLHEAGDKNLARRMVEAGARTASTERVVATLNVVWPSAKAGHPWSQPS